MRNKFAALGVVSSMAVSVVFVATQAGAATIPPVPGGAICGSQITLSFNSNGNGGWWSSNDAEWQDLGGQTFRQGSGGQSGSNGVGQNVKNNAAWACNDSFQNGVYVYVNSARYGWGAFDYVSPQGYGNLVTTYNNEASYSIYSH